MPLFYFQKHLQKKKSQQTFENPTNWGTFLLPD